MSGFLQPIARSFEVEANRTLTVTVRHSRAFLRHNICQATVSHTLRQPGNASTPTKTIKSVALLGSDCQSETIDYTDEGFICQAQGCDAESGRRGDAVRRRIIDATRVSFSPRHRVSVSPRRFFMVNP